MFRLPSPSLVISMLALTIALGGASYSANGGNFILGVTNSATTLTRLVTPFNGAALRVDNTSAAVNATGITIVTNAARPPMRLNSSTKVANLNADQLDGLDSTNFAQVVGEGWNYVGDSGKPAFENGWVNFNGHGAAHNTVTNQHAAFRKDNLGVIHLTGLVSGGTIGQTIFTLPSGHCPFFTKIFPAISNNAFARITVNRSASGCAVFANIGSNTWVSLDGVKFLSPELEVRIN